MKKIPKALIFSRLVLGIIILIIPFFHITFYKELIITLLIIGLLTDIFDGIIARKLGISSQHLRRLDSLIDQIFWTCTLISVLMICPDFFKENQMKFYLLIGAEILTYIISYLKFKKEVSTHAILSKIWTLSIVTTLIEVIIHCNSGWLFSLCFYLGLISRAEVMMIILVIKEWTTDVPSIYHALQLRKGKTIKRHKFFNG